MIATAGPADRSPSGAPFHHAREAERGRRHFGDDHPPREASARDPRPCPRRYCLAEWEQSGHSAVYSFLDEV
jgi:hypothetical protein